MLCCSIGGELVMRAYTPTSSDDELGYFDLVIKVTQHATTQPPKHTLLIRKSRRQKNCLNM